MKTTTTLVFSTVGLLAALASAADITGQWHAEFEGRRGPQKIQFEFKTAEGKLIGKTVSQFGGEAREVEIQDGKIDGNAVSFAQTMNLQGNDVRITYTGNIGEDGITFTRKVGDFASSDFKAARGPLPSASGPAEPSMPATPGQVADVGPDDKPAYDPPPAGFNER